MKDEVPAVELFLHCPYYAILSLSSEVITTQIKRLCSYTSVTGTNSDDSTGETAVELLIPDLCHLMALPPAKKGNWNVSRPTMSQVFALKFSSESDCPYEG